MTETTTKWPPCDACGKPSTSAARDMLRTDDGSSHWNYQPLGDVKYGCDEHPVSSHTETSMPYLFRGLAESLREPEQ